MGSRASCTPGSETRDIEDRMEKMTLSFLQHANVVDILHIALPHSRLCCALRFSIGDSRGSSPCPCAVQINNHFIDQLGANEWLHTMIRAIDDLCGRTRISSAHTFLPNLHEKMALHCVCMALSGHFGGRHSANSNFPSMTHHRFGRRRSSAPFSSSQFAKRRTLTGQIRVSGREKCA